MKSKNSFKNIKSNQIWDSENIFYLKTDIFRISALIYHYEIYKKIVNLPGDIIECGVFKGISLTRFLTFREILENAQSRKIYGFDVFGKFPKSKLKSDKKFIKNWELESGNGINKDELDKIFLDKKFSNFELIKGDIENTLPIFLKKKPELKISLLHLDMDIYEPTKHALEYLFNRVVKGGLILIDDYAIENGATKAVDEFLKINKDLKIQKLNFSYKPSYIIKIK